MLLFLRDLFFKDIWLKLFSLSLAVLIWLTVSFAHPGLPLHSVERTLLLPVVIMSSAADVRSFKVNPKEVEVTIKGEARILSTLQPKEIRVMVDLTDVRPVGDVYKRIEVSTPSGVTHVHVEPQDVLVIFPPKT